jgi:hypothetical protein
MEMTATQIEQVARRIRESCIRAYNFESHFIEVNRWTMSREELMSALATLLCLGHAIDEAGRKGQ